MTLPSHFSIMTSSCECVSRANRHQVLSSVLCRTYYIAITDTEDGNRPIWATHGDGPFFLLSRLLLTSNSVHHHFLTYSLHSDYPTARRGSRRGSRRRGTGARSSRTSQSASLAPRSNVNRYYFSHGPVCFELRGLPSTDAATRCRGMQQGTQSFLRARLGSSTTRASKGVTCTLLCSCT